MGDQNEEANLVSSGESHHVATPQERAERAGYTTEAHEVATEDGYILQLYRITGSNDSPKADDKPVVFLLHGLLDCSVTWELLEEKSLAFMLADRGYDVWLGNVRGSRYSLKHKWMSSTQDRYWLFSWHEIGMYDLPAMIDYTLEVTKKEKLIYVGHSQGCTTFFVMASMRPEYQQKIAAMFALAPAVFMRHASLPLLTLLAPFAHEFEMAGNLIGLHEFKPTPEFLRQLNKHVCEDRILQPLCKTAISIFTAPGETLIDQVIKIRTYTLVQLNRPFKSLIAEAALYDPTGASTRQLVHYAQLKISGRFCQFDYGRLTNMRRYHRHSPPDYPLENIKIPVYLYHSKNDAFVSIQDMKTLHEKLSNAERFLVPEPSFTHLDFVWGKSADTLVYDNVLSLMLKYVQKDS